MQGVAPLVIAEDVDFQPSELGRLIQHLVKNGDFLLPTAGSSIASCRSDVIGTPGGASSSDFAMEPVSSSARTVAAARAMVKRGVRWSGLT